MANDHTIPTEAPSIQPTQIPGMTTQVPRDIQETEVPKAQPTPVSQAATPSEVPSSKPSTLSGEVQQLQNGDNQRQ